MTHAGGDAAWYSRLFPLEHFPKYHSPKNTTVRPEPVEGMNGWCSVRKARPWFDKLTTNGFFFARATVKRNML